MDITDEIRHAIREAGEDRAVIVAPHNIGIAWCPLHAVAPLYGRWWRPVPPGKRRVVDMGDKPGLTGEALAAATLFDVEVES